VPAFETRNGQMWPQANHEAQRLARRLGKLEIAGSDSHTMAGVGSTYTEVPGARNTDEFLAGLREGAGVVHGVHGSYRKITADVYRVVRSLLDAEPWTLPLMPLAVFVPVFTAAHWLNEILFCRKWSARLVGGQKATRLLGPLGTSLESKLAN